MGWDGRNWVMDGGDKPKKVNPVENLPDANPQEVAGTQNKAVGQQPVSDIQNGMDYAPELLKANNKEIYQTNDWYDPKGKGNDLNVIFASKGRRPVGLTETDRIRQGKMQAGIDLENFDNSIANGNHVAKNPGRRIVQLETTAPVVEPDANGNRSWGYRQMKPRSFLVNEKGEITNTLEAKGYDEYGNATGWKSSEAGRYWGDHYDPNALKPKAVTQEDKERAMASQFEDKSFNQLRNIERGYGRAKQMAQYGEGMSYAQMKAKQKWDYDREQGGARPLQAAARQQFTDRRMAALNSNDAAGALYEDIQASNARHWNKVRPPALSGAENYEYQQRKDREMAKRRAEFEKTMHDAQVAKTKAEATALLEMPKLANKAIITGLAATTTPSKPKSAVKTSN